MKNRKAAKANNSCAKSTKAGQKPGLYLSCGGNAPKTQEEFFARYKGLVSALLEAPNIMGFCYTQLYDVEQEVNDLHIRP